MESTQPHCVLGDSLPEFRLRDVVGQHMVSAEDFAGKPLLVAFICNHCPYVRHVEHELARIGMDFAGRMGMVGICSNDPVRSPGDTPAELAAQYARVSMTFPYLFDETQDVARAFGASCTPDLFLFDTAHQLVYRGRIDASRPGSTTPVTGEDIRAAIDSVMRGVAVSGEQHPSIGCSIKWREEPSA
jgi:hypothetical protein